MMENCTPDQLNICWIDPGRNETSLYKGTPFCPIDPVVDMGDAYGLMEYLDREMNRRHNMIDRVCASNIDEFNMWVEDNPVIAGEKGLKTIPYIVVAINDYADMVAQSPQVEEPILNLVQKAHTVGIHLIVVTQRPSATIISRDAKDNLSARICLPVTDETASCVVIDQPGAEKLEHPGDMLFKDKAGQVTFLQSKLISQEKVREVCEKSRELYGSPTPIDHKENAVENRQGRG